MNTLLEDLQRYIFETLGASCTLVKASLDKELPRKLLDVCTFFELELLETKYLLMTVKGTKESSPVYVKKMIELLFKYWNGSVIYLLPRVTGYNRKRLIERKIPFVVPGNQMYLPQSGLDLREHFQKLRVKKKNFSPSTQVILLAMFYGRLGGRMTPSSLASKLGYSTMTMSRGLDELTYEGLFTEHTEWRERVVHFEGDRKDLWSKVKNRMKSPVRKRYYILLPASTINLPIADAGGSALSRYNMLDKPLNPVLAVSGETWKSLMKIDGVIELENEEPDSVVVEVWKYAPEIFSKKRLTDPISLYLSMQDSVEEDTGSALTKLITFVDEGLRNVQNSMKTK